ncbi:MAG: hypothetical protein U9P42_06885, partial [Candidatus Fermentibacteria bacterium]|nr:hypothetical protein [Candidatus Fermentibacteria bacterium]
SFQLPSPRRSARIHEMVERSLPDLMEFAGDLNSIRGRRTIRVPAAFKKPDGRITLYQACWI